MESEWVNVKEDYKDYYGFVYKITNLKTGQYYIGKKFFWSMKTMKPLKGKTRKRHSLVESDWKSYWSSSPKLKEAVAKLGKENFKREIITYCANKFECAYYEAAEQFNKDVLFDNKSYNEVINLRLRKAKNGC